MWSRQTKTKIFFLRLKHKNLIYASIHLPFLNQRSADRVISSQFITSLCWFQESLPRNIDLLTIYISSLISFRKWNKIAIWKRKNNASSFETNRVLIYFQLIRCVECWKNDRQFIANKWLRWWSAARHRDRKSVSSSDSMLRHHHDWVSKQSDKSAVVAVTMRRDSYFRSPWKLVIHLLASEFPDNCLWWRRETLNSWLTNL